MKMYQPMLFVGLGGTGCLIGAELERQLRDEICGPDGTAFSRRAPDGKLMPYQLPSCVQFVYADFSEAQLNRLPYRQAEGGLRAAYSQTSRASHNLLPKVDSSPEITRSLRVALPMDVRPWLPPREDEPHIAPLAQGAGQLPTVGRACLFETFRNGLDAALEPLQTAIKKIVRSGVDMNALGGDLQARGWDVFVAFSVAGGTGAGIFYDYLHLVAKAFDDAGLRVKIYPMVLMPSAFRDHQGGGRAAELNAARALVDLFRLVDTQNAPDASDELGDDSVVDSAVVRYPDVNVRMRPSIVQTAFLFSRTAGIEREDLHRSVVSMIMSLISTGPDRGQSGAGEAQSFAESFVNRSADRADRAGSGIGRKGVSTGLVAQMTIPVDELAELLAGRLLAAGVSRLDEQARAETDRGRELIRRLFGSAGIEELWGRKPEDFNDVETERGAAAINRALAVRRDEMLDALDRLDGGLHDAVRDLARAFNPAAGVPDLIRSAGIDPFRLYWTVTGRTEAADKVVREGFAGMVRGRRREPDRPAGVEVAPPQPQRIRDRVPGAVRARWADPEVHDSLADQDRWYEWRSRAVWHRHWNEHAQRWLRTLEGFEGDVSAVREAFLGFVAGEKEFFRQRRQELYRERTAVSYLLPPQSDLARFYDDVIRRLVRAESLGDTADAGDLVRALIPAELWQRVYGSAVGRDPQEGVLLLKDHLKRRILELFVSSGGRDEQPLLPSLGELLAAAATGDRSLLDERTLEWYRQKIASLLLPGFEPEGSGRLRTLIVYPETKQDAQVRRFLEQRLLLPRDADVDYRAATTDSISVVMYRSTMSLTEVPEVCRVMRTYAQAVKEDRRDDHLMWRQRLGWREDWMAGTPEERTHILHRLLCAMWNGQIEVRGDPGSPRRIRVTSRTSDGVAMTLDLNWYDQAVSSWGSLLPAYEAWTLLDNGSVAQDFCASLMRTVPAALESPPRPPSPLLREFVDVVAPSQLKLLDGPRFAGEEWVRPLHEFWRDTLTRALDQRFSGPGHGPRTTLRRLLASYGDGPEVERAERLDRSDRAAADDDWADADGARRPAPPRREPRGASDWSNEDDAGFGGEDV